MTKILFLDVDGVLNYSTATPRGQKWPYVICPEAVKRLDKVVTVTGCNIVMSSTWRLHKDAMGYLYCEYPRLKSLLMKDWRTPFGKDDEIRMSDYRNRTRHIRGMEINVWLNRNEPVERYAIVDDDDDMLPDQLSRFVQTSWDHGLLDRHVDELIHILGEKK